jgi:signal peptidase I
MTVDEPVVPPGHGDDPGVPSGAESRYRTETDAGPPTTRSRTPMDDESPMTRRDRTPPPPRPPGAGRHLGAAAREMIVVAAMALVLSFVVKTWLMQAFYIPSDSMEDTLVRHDRVVVSKLTPGPMDLKRGDVVVFADPGNWLQEPAPADRGAFLNTLRDGLIFIGLLPDTSEGHLIKRVIGLPGDRVVCCDKKDRIPTSRPGRSRVTRRSTSRSPRDVCG